MKSLDTFVLIAGFLFSDPLSQLAWIGFHNLLDPRMWLPSFSCIMSQISMGFGADLLDSNTINSIFLIAKLEDALQKGLRIISLFAFIVATIVVMYGGYQIRTGNPDAGKMSILGGLVIGLAVIIVTSIFEIADLPVLKITK